MKTAPKNGVGRKHFGRLPVQLVGKERWDAQDHASAWSDEGEVGVVLKKAFDDALAPIVQALEGVVAKNASLGASEYLALSEASATLSPDGELMIGVRVANDAVAMVAYVPFTQLIKSILSEIRPSLGIDPQAQAMLSQMIAIGRGLATLGQPINPNQPRNGAADHKGPHPHE